MGRAVEAYAHCWTPAEIRNLTEEDHERFRTHGHIFLIRALRSNKNSTAVVSALLDLPEIPINLSETDRDGNTVLIVAVQVRNHEAVKLLLSRLDSDPNVGNRITGNTALHEAAKSADCLDILVTLLGEQRVNVDVVNSDGQSPLHVACISRGRQLAVTEVVREIIDADRDTVWRVDRFGRTAVHYLSESGNAEAVEVLLQAAGAGAQKLALERDNKGHPAIHLAVKAVQSSVVDLLLKFGDCEDGDGNRIVHHAVQSNCTDMIDRCLSEHPTLKINHSFAEVVNLILVLLTVTTDVNIAYFLLAKLDANDNIACFLNTKLDANHVQFKGKWPVRHPPPLPGRLLLWAILSGVDHRDRGALLIKQILKWLPEQAGAPLNPSTLQTALHISVINQNVEAVKALCSESGQRHIKGDACDSMNKTALDYAFDKKNEIIRRTLREHRDVKSEHEELEKSSGWYVNAANTILVGSALVVTLTYTHCLSSLETAKLREDLLKLGLPDLKEKKLQIVDFIVLARLAFFFALTATVMAAFAAFPFSVTNFFQQAVDDRYKKELLGKKKILVMGASYFLVLSLGAVLFNFICSTLVAPYIDYNCETACHIALAVYAILTLVWIGKNGVPLYKNWTRTKSPKKQNDKQQLEQVVFG